MPCAAVLKSLHHDTTSFTHSWHIRPKGVHFASFWNVVFHFLYSYWYLFCSLQVYHPEEKQQKLKKGYGVLLQQTDLATSICTEVIPSWYNKHWSKWKGSTWRHLQYLGNFPENLDEPCHGVTRVTHKY